MGSEEIYGNQISHESKEIRDKVLKDDNTTNKNFNMNKTNNGSLDVQFENEADFYRKKSLKEDFLIFNVTVEGITNLFLNICYLFSLTKNFNIFILKLIISKGFATLLITITVTKFLLTLLWL